MSNEIAFIPCELCDELISFDDYSNHLRECIRPRQRRRYYLNDNITFTIPVSQLTNNQNEEDEEEEEEDEEEEELPTTEDYNSSNETLINYNRPLIVTPDTIPSNEIRLEPSLIQSTQPLTPSTNETIIPLTQSNTTNTTPTQVLQSEINSPIQPLTTTTSQRTNRRSLSYLYTLLNSIERRFNELDEADYYIDNIESNLSRNINNNSRYSHNTTSNQHTNLNQPLNNNTDIIREPRIIYNSASAGTVLGGASAGTVLGGASAGTVLGGASAGISNRGASAGTVLDDVYAGISNRGASAGTVLGGASAGISNRGASAGISNRGASAGTVLGGASAGTVLDDASAGTVLGGASAGISNRGASAGTVLDDVSAGTVLGGASAGTVLGGASSAGTVLGGASSGTVLGGASSAGTYNEAGGVGNFYGASYNLLQNRYSVPMHYQDDEIEYHNAMRENVRNYRQRIEQIDIRHNRDMNNLRERTERTERAARIGRIRNTLTTNYLTNLVSNYYNTNNPVTNNNSYESLTELGNRIGNVSVGIKDLKNISKEYILDNDEECFVCRDEFKKNDKMMILNCGHYFCLECCQNWFRDNKKCPVCMKEFNETESTNNISIATETIV